MMEGELLGWKAEYRRRDDLFLRFVMKVWWQVVASLPADAREDAITKTLVNRLDADTWVRALFYCDYQFVPMERTRDGSLAEDRFIDIADPFGMQVPWKTLVSLAETKAIEVLVNFPVGMAIQRLLPRNSKFTDNARRKLDWYFGTTEWHSLMYEKYMGLFGEDVEKSSEAADKLVKWYRSRLKDIFGHVSVAREVQTQAGRPLYYLIFAGPNRVGVRIANDVLKQGAREVR